MTDQPFPRLTCVSKRFGGINALTDIDWDMRRGEIHCLVGENGCGKSIHDLPDWWTKRVTFYRTELVSGDIVRITLPVVLMIAVTILISTSITVLSSRRGRRHSILDEAPDHG